MVDFGIRIKELRETKNLTQAQLAERLNITKSMVSAYENSLRYPSFTVLLRISRLFKVSTDYLLGEQKHATIDISRLNTQQLKLLLGLIEQFESENKTK